MTPRPRILLVEDSPLQARLVREFTADALDVEWADRLSTALDRLRQGGIDAVLLELSLPDSWGVDTLRRVVEARPDLPVLVFSGGDREQVAAEALRSGAAAVLFKDGRYEETIVKAVRAALSRRRGSGETGEAPVRQVPPRR